MVMESVRLVGTWWGAELDWTGEISSLEHRAMDLRSTADDVSCLLVGQMQNMLSVTKPSAQLRGEGLVFVGAINQCRGQRSGVVLIRRGLFERGQRSIRY